VLEEFGGIPAHPLIIHVPVVFIPLLALLAAAYALVPVVRPHTRWVLGLLALATPIAALLAKLSGDALYDGMREANLITPDFFPRIDEHQDLGNMTLFVTIALAVLTLALVYFVRPRPGTGAPKALALLLGALTIVAAGVSLYYVIRTGDTGANNVWEDIDI
jgi:hypothetical protein